MRVDKQGKHGVVLVESKGVRLVRYSDINMPSDVMCLDVELSQGWDRLGVERWVSFKDSSAYNTSTMRGVIQTLAEMLAEAGFGGGHFK